MTSTSTSRQVREGAAARITATVSSWPGVEFGPHRFAGVQFRLGRRELGHLHGDTTADIPFPRSVRDELIAEGRAEEHRWAPDSGWVTFAIRSDDDVDCAIELFRMAYERAVNAKPRSEPPAAA